MVDPQAMAGVSAPQGVSNTQPPGPQQPMQPMDPAMAQQAPPAAPAAKPSGLIPSDLAQLLAQSINKAKMEAAKGLSERLGEPRGTVNAKIVDLLRVWRKRNPEIDPLYEKFINGKSDEEIMYSMYPARRALIRYGRRTYTEQVEFAEWMNKLDHDPKYAKLDQADDGDSENPYDPPQSKYPSRGEEDFMDQKERDRAEAEQKATEEE